MGCMVGCDLVETLGMVCPNRGGGDLISEHLSESSDLHSESDMSILTAVQTLLPEKQGVKALLSMSDSVRESLHTGCTLGAEGKRLSECTRQKLQFQVARSRSHVHCFRSIDSSGFLDTPF
jgi:hypothetical protein